MQLHTLARKIFIAFMLAGIFCPNSFGFTTCQERVSFIQNGLSEARVQAHVWSLGWGLTWSIATGAQLAVAATTHQVATREDLFAGALSSSLGLIPTWIFPPLVSEGDIQFSRCDQLSEAEARLNQDAMYDDKMTGPLAHVSNIIVNLAISAALGVGYGHWSSAWISSAAGIPVGELMILSYPRAASRLRNHYRSEEPDLAQDHSMLDHGHLAWVPGPDAQALVLSLNF
jgi:hypothetical protein